jgi:hypothetical protein
MNGTPPASDVPVVPDFKDRRTGLIVFGILEIVLGALAALMIPLMIFGQVMAAQATDESPPLRQMLPGVITYGIIAAVLIASGIGSCKAQRWARALSLSVAWSWLAVGVITMVAMVFILPSMLKTGPQTQGQELSESVRLVVMVVAMVFVGTVFVIVPGILVSFYQSRHVRATCEARNPLPCWTDACPLPLLTLSLLLGFGAITLFVLPISANGVLPLFGKLLSGVVGSLCCLGLAVLWAYSAWAIYRLRIVGWWLVLISICVLMVSAWVTFTQIDVVEMYKTMGYSEQQLEMIKQYSFFQQHNMRYFSVAGAIPMLALLLFVKRYFRPSHKVPLT